MATAPSANQSAPPAKPAGTAHASKTTTTTTTNTVATPAPTAVRLRLVSQPGTVVVIQTSKVYQTPAGGSVPSGALPPLPPGLDHPSFPAQFLCPYFAEAEPTSVSRATAGSICPRGAACPYVHANPRGCATHQPHVRNIAAVATNPAATTTAESYARYAPGDRVALAAPASSVAKELVPSEQLLETQVLKCKRRPLRHCARFASEGYCERGRKCDFAHAVPVLLHSLTAATAVESDDDADDDLAHIRAAPRVAAAKLPSFADTMRAAAARAAAPPGSATESPALDWQDASECDPVTNVDSDMLVAVASAPVVISPRLEATAMPPGGYPVWLAANHHHHHHHHHEAMPHIPHNHHGYTTVHHTGWAPAPQPPPSQPQRGPPPPYGSPERQPPMAAITPSSTPPQYAPSLPASQTAEAPPGLPPRLRTHSLPAPPTVSGDGTRSNGSGSVSAGTPPASTSPLSTSGNGRRRSHQPYAAEPLRSSPA
eukprot:CAMPEP_0174834238 /NCGR_PEP_ID=MMETSP1114-20130205/4707_1 /TAXON_ID=312471 /ORGANISM="Neobodo designis, Strain CCAP 1951/1" /LENGTH=484 /DNA_ID=CAMNT_0016068145 /DNA_START=315 /DNA_END=1769 /DNA_ORIENTATION=-